MKNTKIEKLNSKSKDLIGVIVKNTAFKNYCKAHPSVGKDISKMQGYYTYWVALQNEKPVALWITAPLEPEEAIKAWVEEGEERTWISYVGLSSQEQAPLFEAFFQSQPQGTRFLADPEAQQEALIEIYAQAGFIKRGSIVRGKGFFKGTAHYVLTFL